MKTCPYGKPNCGCIGPLTHKILMSEEYALVKQEAEFYGAFYEAGPPNALKPVTEKKTEPKDKEEIERNEKGIPYF